MSNIWSDLLGWVRVRLHAVPFVGAQGLRVGVVCLVGPAVEGCRGPAWSHVQWYGRFCWIRTRGGMAGGRRGRVLGGGTPRRELDWRRWVQWWCCAAAFGFGDLSISLERSYWLWCVSVAHVILIDPFLGMGLKDLEHSIAVCMITPFAPP